METEGSLLHSQVLAICPCYEPAHWSLSLKFPHQNPVYASPLPHTRYMPRPFHSSRFYHANNTGWAVQIIQLLTDTFLHKNKFKWENKFTRTVQNLDEMKEE